MENKINTKTRQTRETYILDKRTLIKVFKQFKRTPKKVYVVRDFFQSSPNVNGRKYLNLLISLGLVEEVIAICRCGKNNSTRRSAKGYKLK